VLAQPIEPQTATPATLRPAPPPLQSEVAATSQPLATPAASTTQPVILAHTPEVSTTAAPVLDLKGFKAPADWPQVTWLNGDAALPVALNQLAETPRLYVETKQPVAARLVFPQGRPGDRVRVELLDGGSLSNGTPGQLLTLGDDKALKLEAKISDNDGIHRVRLTTDTVTLILNFWAGAENTYHALKL
jgi:hypothetical protein